MPRPTRIIDRITRQQAVNLILEHPSAREIKEKAHLLYHPQSRWWQRGKPVRIFLFVDDVADNHLYQLECKHSSVRYDITITLSRRMPGEYRNTFYLYCLGMALEKMEVREGTLFSLLGSSLSPLASQAGFDMIALSEGPKTVSEIPWLHKAA